MLIEILLQNLVGKSCILVRSNPLIYYMYAFQFCTSEPFAVYQHTKGVAEAISEIFEKLKLAFLLFWTKFR